MTWFGTYLHCAILTQTDLKETIYYYLALFIILNKIIKTFMYGS